ncbi:hypothetical protein VULLAG_LOCUS9952 [Vulpes lagopus]
MLNSTKVKAAFIVFDFPLNESIMEFLATSTCVAQTTLFLRWPQMQVLEFLFQIHLDYHFDIDRLATHPTSAKDTTASSGWLGLHSVVGLEAQFLVVAMIQQAVSPNGSVGRAVGGGIVDSDSRV